MKEICMQGFNSQYVTMKCEGTAEPGDLVVMCADNTVKKAASGKFAGVVRSMRGEHALVQTGGFAVLHHSGSDRVAVDIAQYPQRPAGGLYQAGGGQQGGCGFIRERP